MVDKFLNSKVVRRVLVLVLVISLFTGFFTAVYPATKRSERINFLGANALSSTSTLSTAFGAFASADISTLTSNPQISSEYKTLSGVLTKITIDNKYSSIYTVYKGVGGKYYTLLDSRYRDTGVAGTDYFAPGTQYTSDVLPKVKGTLDRIYSQKVKSNFDSGVITNDRGDQIIVSCTGIYSPSGEVLGVMICEVPASGTDFSQFGIVNLTVLSIISFIVCIATVVLLVLMRRWKQTRTQKQGTKQELAAKQLAEKQAADREELEKLKAEKEIAAKQATQKTTTPDPEDDNIPVIPSDEIEIIPPSDR